MTSKDSSIERLLKALPLKERAWVIVDHWDGDLLAVGIARKDEPRRLVYVSTRNAGKGKYYYECEVPSGPDQTDYSVTDEGDEVDFDTLLRAMTKHLSRRGK